MEIDREPVGEENDFGRDRRAVGVRHLPEEGEVEAGEAVDGPRPPSRRNGSPRPRHRLGVGGLSEDLQGEVGLHARADVDGTTPVDRPASGGELLPEDPPHRAGNMRPFEPAIPGENEEILALQDRVPLERPAPVTVGSLPLQEPVGGRGTRPEDAGMRRLARTKAGRGRAGHPGAAMRPHANVVTTASRGNRRGLGKPGLDRRSSVAHGGIRAPSRAVRPAAVPEPAADCQPSPVRGGRSFASKRDAPPSAENRETRGVPQGPPPGNDRVPTADFICSAIRRGVDHAGGSAATLPAMPWGLGGDALGRASTPHRAFVSHRVWGSRGGCPRFPRQR